MANFRFSVTTEGRTLLAKAQAGKEFRIQRLELGTGITNGTLDLTSLIDKKLDLAITSVITEDDVTTISSQLQLQNVETGFDWNEIGVIVADPDTGDDVLYFYGNSAGQGDYIPSASEATVIEKIIRVVIATTNVDNITFDSSDASIFFVSHKDLENKANEIIAMLDVERTERTQADEELKTEIEEKIETETEERKEADRHLQAQIDNISLTPVDSARPIGELIMGLWDIGEQPFGFYPCVGGMYYITSPVAQHVINNIPNSVKKLFYISERYILFPNLVDPMEEANEFGFFPRFGRTAGEKRGDAIRNITGKMEGIHNLHIYAGAFYSEPPDRLAISSSTRAGQHSISFDASRVVPTATENRPQSYTVIPYIYIGIEYVPEEYDMINEYIAGKLVTKQGYVQPYLGEELVGYWNKAFPCEGGVAYCVNPLQGRRSNDTEPAITMPLPESVLNKYGLGVELDENKKFIRPITHNIIVGSYKSPNKFVYFETHEDTRYLLLNVEEFQLETYRISKTENLWLSHNIVDSEGYKQIQNIPMVRDHVTSYFKNGIYSVRAHTTNGFNFNDVRPNQSYIDVWQLVQQQIPSTQDNSTEYTQYNVKMEVTKFNEGYRDWWQIYPENIYTETPEVEEPEYRQESYSHDFYYSNGESFDGYTCATLMFNEKCLNDMAVTGNNGHIGDITMGEMSQMLRFWSYDNLIASTFTFTSNIAFQYMWDLFYGWSDLFPLTAGTYHGQQLLQAMNMSEQYYKNTSVWIWIYGVHPCTMTQTKLIPLARILHEQKYSLKGGKIYTK